MPSAKPDSITFMGVTASPFQLKMQSLADATGIRWKLVPREVGSWTAIRVTRRINRERKAGRVQRFTGMSQGMDEYPSVPYYWFDESELFYDSTGLALHLDSFAGTNEPLLPDDAPTRFICRLIDDAFDEFGLYMAHHNRWVTSTTTNRMGITTAGELGKLFPIIPRALIAKRMSRRQVRRCPYLFSVSPPDFETGLGPALTPPSRYGFPATHTLLDLAFRRYLAAIEAVLSQQPYLLGERFTLADASAYGQLNMHHLDPTALRIIEELAPTTFNWIRRIERAEHMAGLGVVALEDSLAGLIDVIAETYIPLMQQNEQAYKDYEAKGQTEFNETAFDRNQALYDGVLMDFPFRAVVKTFQVASWREIQREWHGLERREQHSLLSRFPGLSSMQPGSA